MRNLSITRSSHGESEFYRDDGMTACSFAAPFGLSAQFPARSLTRQAFARMALTSCSSRPHQSLVGDSRVASLRPFRFAPKTFNKKIDKETNFHGKVARRRIDCIKGQERRLVFMEEASQRAFPKRLFRNERRQQSNATPFYCTVAQHLRVVGAEEPRWLD